MISYHAISDAIFHYEKCGYKCIEAPWYVPEWAIKVTANEGTNYKVNKLRGGYLVGSAEQSFLYMIDEGELDYGKYCAATPCFRDDQNDEWHQKYFMKVELINYFEDLGSCNLLLEEMINNAREFFIRYDKLPIYLKKTYDPRSLISYDIELNGIELGSYGVRTHGDINWIYGTGVAEPRYTDVVKKYLKEGMNEDYFKI